MIKSIVINTIHLLNERFCKIRHHVGYVYIHPLRTTHYDAGYKSPPSVNSSHHRIRAIFSSRQNCSLRLFFCALSMEFDNIECCNTSPSCIPILSTTDAILPLPKDASNHLPEKRRKTRIRDLPDVLPVHAAACQRGGCRGVPYQ